MDSVSQQIKFEAESLKKDLENANESLELAQTSLNKASAEEVDLQIQVGQRKLAYDEAKQALSNVEQMITTLSSTIKELTTEKNRIAKKTEVATIDIKKLSVKVESFESGKLNAERVISSLRKKYEWIESERHSFGVVGGDYDFENIDPSEMGAKLKKLKEEQSSLVSG